MASEGEFQFFSGSAVGLDHFAWSSVFPFLIAGAGRKAHRFPSGHFLVRFFSFFCRASSRPFGFVFFFFLFGWLLFVFMGFSVGFVEICAATFFPLSRLLSSVCLSPLRDNRVVLSLIPDGFSSVRFSFPTGSSFPCSAFFLLRPERAAPPLWFFFKAVFLFAGPCQLRKCKRPLFGLARASDVFFFFFLMFSKKPYLVCSALVASFSLFFLTSELGSFFAGVTFPFLFSSMINCSLFSDAPLHCRRRRVSFFFPSCCYDPPCQS